MLLGSVTWYKKSLFITILPKNKPIDKVIINAIVISLCDIESNSDWRSLSSPSISNWPIPGNDDIVNRFSKISFHSLIPIVIGFLESKNSKRSVISFLFLRNLLSIDRTRFSFSLIFNKTYLLSSFSMIVYSLEPCITAIKENDDDDDNDDNRYS